MLFAEERINVTIKATSEIQEAAVTNQKHAGQDGTDDGQTREVTQAGNRLQQM